MLATIFRLLLCASPLLSLPAPAAAQLELVNVQGDVQKKGHPVLPGAPVGSGDELRTGKDGYATLKRADGSMLALQPGSRVAIDSVSPTRFTLQGGRIEASVPKRAGSARFEVRTSVSVAAVLGAKFRVAADETGRSATYEVLEGSVQVNDARNLGGVTVAEGYGTKVREGSAPVAPRALLPEPRLWGGVRLILKKPARLNFTRLAGATSYRLVIAQRADFGEIVMESILPGVEILLPDLPDGVYFVKVRGIDEQGLEGRDSTADLVVSIGK